MAIDEKLSLTNTFTGGMNTDISDEMIPDNQYRYAENIRVTADGDSTSGKINLINGIEALNITYDVSEPQEILAVDSIKNYVCLITSSNINVTDSDTTRCWNIFVNTNYGAGLYERVFGPCTRLIWNPDDKTNGINTELYWVQDKNVKLYISSPTELYGIMYVNLAKQYNSGDINLLVTNNYIETRKPEVEKIAGNLTGPVLYYCYKLFTPSGGTSALSPVSDKIILYSRSDGTSYDQHGLSGGESSEQGVHITIPHEAFGTYTKIFVYRIEYSDGNNLPTIINISGSEGDPLLEDTDFTKDDTVQSSPNYVSATLEEVLSDVVSDDQMPSVIKIKNDRLFSASINYQQDDVDDLFSKLDTTAPSSGNFKDGKFTYDHQQFTSANITKYNENYWHKPGTNTIGGAGPIISWTMDWEPYWLSYLNGYTTAHKCFRSGEVYRFGIVFYTENGRKTNPKWICDIMLPEPKLYDCTYREATDTSNSSNYGGNVIYNILFRVDIPKITFKVDTEAIKNKVSTFSGYEIVIAEKTEDDTICLAQGLYTDAEYGRPGFAYKNYSRILPRRKELFFSPDIWFNNTGELICKTIRNNKGSVIPQLDHMLRCFSRHSKGSSAIAPGTNFADYITPEYWKQKAIEKYYTFTPKFGTYDGANTYLNEDNEQTQHYWEGYKYLYSDFNLEHTWRVNKRTGRNYIGGYLNTFIPSVAINNFYSGFATGSTVTDAKWANVPYGDDTDAIKNIEQYYVTLSNGEGFNAWNYPDSNEDTLAPLDPNNDATLYYPATSAGQCAVLEFSNGAWDGDVKFSDLFNEFYLPIVTLKKTNVTPYGGHNELSTQSTKYYSVGKYQFSDVNEVVFMDDGKGTSYGVYRFMMYHNYVNEQYCYRYGSLGALCMIPVFSNRDLQALDGALCRQFDKGWPVYSEVAMIQDQAVNYSSVEKKSTYQDESSYSIGVVLLSLAECKYNDAYNRYQDQIVYQNTSAYVKEIWSDQRNRIYASEPSSGDDLTDNMLNFSDNYINIPNEYGDITCMTNFRNRLYFWQEGSFGTVDVNERAIVQAREDSQANSAANDLIIGKSGVLERYDYISREYGMARKLNCFVVTDNGIYWWDSNKREILQFNGQQIINLSTIKGIKNYIKNGQDSDNPGIFYDDDNKEVIFSILNEESIVYSELLQQFVSVYKINPKIGTRNIKNLLISRGDGLYKYNASTSKNTTGYSIGFDNEPLYPKLKYIINKNPGINKTFDTVLFDGRFYPYTDIKEGYKHKLDELSFNFSTSLNQNSELPKDSISDRENDFRFDIPRAGVSLNNHTIQYGNRMRGKTMECEFSSSNNSTDFSLQYITTKFRISWT